MNNPLAIVNFKSGTYSADVKIVHKLLTIQTFTSLSIVPSQLVQGDFNLNFRNKRVGSKTNLDIYLNNPCVLLPSDTIMEISFTLNSSLYSSTTNNYPFEAKTTNYSCKISLNGIEQNALCNTTTTKILIYNFLGTSYTDKYAMFSIPNVLVPHNALSAQIKFYKGANTSDKLFLQGSLLNIEIDFPVLQQNISKPEISVSDPNIVTFECVYKSLDRFGVYADIPLKFGNNTPSISSITWEVRDLASNKYYKTTNTVINKETILRYIRFPMNFQTGVKVTIIYNGMLPKNMIGEQEIFIGFQENRINLFNSKKFMSKFFVREKTSDPIITHTNLVPGLQDLITINYYKQALSTSNATFSLDAGTLGAFPGVLKSILINGIDYFSKVQFTGDNYIKVAGISLIENNIIHLNSLANSSTKTCLTNLKMNVLDNTTLITDKIIPVQPFVENFVINSLKKVVSDKNILKINLYNKQIYVDHYLRIGFQSPTIAAMDKCLINTAFALGNYICQNVAGTNGKNYLYIKNALKFAPFYQSLNLEVIVNDIQIDTEVSIEALSIGDIGVLQDSPLMYTLIGSDVERVSI